MILIFIFIEGRHRVISRGTFDPSVSPAHSLPNFTNGQSSVNKANACQPLLDSALCLCALFLSLSLSQNFSYEELKFTIKFLSQFFNTNIICLFECEFCCFPCQQQRQLSTPWTWLATCMTSIPYIINKISFVLHPYISYFLLCPLH